MTTFSDLLTFSRSGSTTYVDSTGTLQTAADGEPRIGHHIWDGSQWVNEGLLLESESRTNLITYSEDFTDAAWSKIRATVIEIAIASPDGQTNASKIIANTDNNSHFIFEEIAGAVGTFSVYAKAAEYDEIALVENLSGGFPSVQFDLTSGTILSESAGLSGKIESAGDGWFRISVTNETAVTRLYIQLSLGESLSFSGDGSSGVYIYGAQFEQGSTPSSYIPTAGSTVTRAAETLTAPSANLPWSSSAISIAMEGTETYADEGTAGQVTLYDRRVDANNRITLTLDTDSTKTGTFTLTLVNGGSTETISTTGEITPGVNKPFNLAFVATSTELGIALNGTAETRVSHTLGLPDLSGADATYEGMGARTLIREWADAVDEAEASS